MLSKDNILRCKFPNIVSFCEIALKIPAFNAWPERGFSALGRIKSKARNKLLDKTLLSLLQVSLNGPKKLNNSTALELGKLWVLEKSRREIHKNRKRIKRIHSSSDDSSDNEDNVCMYVTYSIQRTDIQIRLINKLTKIGHKLKFKL